MSIIGGITSVFDGITSIFGCCKDKKAKNATNTVKEPAQPSNFNVSLPAQLTEDAYDGSKEGIIKLEYPKSNSILEEMFGGGHTDSIGKSKRSSVIKFTKDFNPVEKLKLKPSQVLDGKIKIRMRKNKKGLIFEITSPVKDGYPNLLCFGDKIHQELGGFRNIIQTEVVKNGINVTDVNAYYIDTLGKRAGSLVDISECGAGNVAALLERVLKKVH